MPRNFDDWLKAYTEFTKFSEAPTNIHFFAGVSAIAGALGRKVFFGMGYFKWYPNFYIIVVARPGIATKSTSIGLAADLLRDIPGVHIGPSSITWQALVQFMGGITEQVEINGDFHTMSQATFVASELGTLIDFSNRELIDVLVDLWDGKTGSWEKMTKTNGMEAIVNPWISLIAGVTPAWLAANVPETAIGGGFTSRCIFVYGAEKAQIIAYPHKHIPKDFDEFRQKLLADLEQISLLKGEFKLTPDAEKYGEAWYNDLWRNTPEHLLFTRNQGYLARKQTHMHKLMMVLSASRRDDLLITLDEFKTAEALFTSIENDMLLALDNVGKHAAAINLDELIEFIARRGKVTSTTACHFLSRYGDYMTSQSIINQAISAGRLKVSQIGNDTFYIAC